MPQFQDYHRTVVGYHGTTRETAEEIVTGGTFKPSQNDDDWLGHGIYFWEYAPQQAYQWAVKRYGKDKDVAVLGSMIRLGNCFDLLDPLNTKILKEAQSVVLETVKPIPRNYNSKKYLDCAVFEMFYQTQEDFGDEIIDSTRAVYVPTDAKKRLWKSSWLYEETHVQLCIRNEENILGTWIVKPESE